MKAVKQIQNASIRIGVLILFILVSTNVNSQTLNIDNSQDTQPKTEAQEDIYWQVIAHRPWGEQLSVKAIDKNGKTYKVKAIQNSDDTSILDVKALVKGKRLPIKLIVRENDRYYPVKAITEDGTIIDIKALTDDGKILPIKGVSKSGNIVHIRAISNDSLFYNIMAISPEGKINDVKGIKMGTAKVETIIFGTPIFAHVKAINQDK